jgi:hypothetical protein
MLFLQYTDGPQHSLERRRFGAGVVVCSKTFPHYSSALAPGLDASHRQ